jgi:hypothetical protein
MAGMQERAAQDLFQLLRAQAATSSSPPPTLHMSFFEICGLRCFDLLALPGQQQGGGGGGNRDNNNSSSSKGDDSVDGDEGVDGSGGGDLHPQRVQLPIREDGKGAWRRHSHASKRSAAALVCRGCGGGGGGGGGGRSGGGVCVCVCVASAPFSVVVGWCCSRAGLFVWSPLLGVIHVEGLSVHDLTEVQQMLAAIKAGNKRRKTSKTEVGWWWVGWRGG